MDLPRDLTGWRRVAIFVATALLIVALVHRLRTRGAPLLAIPSTPVEFASPGDPTMHHVILVLEEASRHLPRGATVTCFVPKEGRQQHDATSFLTAVGMLPYQKVLPPFTAGDGLPREQLVEYVVAIYEPFTHSDYREIASFPHGRLYRVQR